MLPQHLLSQLAASVLRAFGCRYDPDLTAIGVTKPGHRKKMTSEINKLSVEGLPDHKPATLAEWLSLIGLGQYYQVLVHNGYENIDFITDITWEDLQEIGITKMGHQKKLMMAVKKLAELQKASDGRGALRKKPSQTSDVVESPPHDGGECMSPKLSTFQDSELSGELQAALSVGAQEGLEPQRGRGPQENSLGKSREPEEGGGVSGGGGPPRKEARVSRQSSQAQSLQRANAPPALSKPRQSYPPGAAPAYTPPQTPTKAKPSSPQTTAPPQAAGKMKSAQHLAQSERAPSSRSLPQSPTHRGHAHVTSQPSEGGEGPPPGPQVNVPLLCLPPEGDESQGDQGAPKKRAHSLVRYAVSDSEQDREELPPADAGKYATVQNRVGRSNSVRGQSEKSGSRAQAIALRQRKKGPPPPPPKRSSSAISSTNLADEPKEEARAGAGGGAGGGALLDVTYHQQRRASDLGGTVDTGSAGSVRSIAAMLEMSSIGGGAKALAMQKPLVSGGQHYLQVSPDRARGAVPQGGGKHREGIGLDGEVVNRRRTISGPVTELVAAARKERVAQESEQLRDRPPPGPANVPAENLPFAEDGNLTIKQRPRQGKGEGDGLPDSLYSLPQDELSRMDATATLKRRARAPDPAGRGQNGTGTGTSTGTIKRRPVSEASATEQPQPQGNGESAPRRDSADLGPPSSETTPRKPIKPPVSPKPVLAQHMRKGGPPTASAKRVPLPGPGGPDSPSTELKRTPPAVSPKPIPPPTAPKPAKVQSVLQSVSTAPSTAPSPAKQPGGTVATTPPSPPRSSISGASIDSSGPSEAAHQKLEETSASLAAALQAVEEKIKQDNSSVAEDKTTVSILDDIGSMFDDLADQLDAMLE
ncbi:hypothetical protein AGOR_G00227990 [Albula goreensis]|uniref:SAM domain-containing protein n=1 Tax=Albula goreensis TaxID=1534307 RepID=A0A8T3CN35_9TELE|nr:hypothetical protein AGOR_G00227990 [Albula goreensis]